MAEIQGRYPRNERELMDERIDEFFRYGKKEKVIYDWRTRTYRTVIVTNLCRTAPVEPLPEPEVQEKPASKRHERLTKRGKLSLSKNERKVLDYVRKHPGSIAKTIIEAVAPRDWSRIKFHIMRLERDEFIKGRGEQPRYYIDRDIDEGV